MTLLHFIVFLALLALWLVLTVAQAVASPGPDPIGAARESPSDTAHGSGPDD